MAGVFKEKNCLLNLGFPTADDKAARDATMTAGLVFMLSVSRWGWLQEPTEIAVFFYPKKLFFNVQATQM